MINSSSADARPPDDVIAICQAGMINSSLKAIVWNQKAEIVSFLISAVSATHARELKMKQLKQLIVGVRENHEIGKPFLPRISSRTLMGCFVPLRRKGGWGAKHPICDLSGTVAS